MFMASITSLKASDGTGNASVATVQSVRSSGATTLVVDTVQGINTKFHATMGTPHTFVDPVTSETITVISEATAVDFKGHVDGGSLEIDTIAPGFTDNGSAVSDIVIIKPTTQWADEVAKVLEVTHNDNGTLKTGSVTNEKLAGGITADKLTPTTWTGSMSALNPVTTSYTNIASVTLPAVTSAHKYLIAASFYFNHNGVASARDYTGAIRNGTTTLVLATWSAAASEYINTVSVNTVFTSSSSGGETINFSVLRNVDNGGFVTASRAFYSIVDLGLA